MAEFKWISIFFIAALQFTAAAERLPLSFTVRVGDEVTLTCENVIDGQRKCDGTTWLFAGSGNRAAVELVRLGQIGENAKAKSDRLSVTASCSLVIKKVTVEDVGYYTCRQFRSGQHQDAHVHLFLINMTEHKDPDKVTFICSVSTFERCRHTVKWLYEGKDVDKDMKTSQSDCTVTVTFLTSSLKQKSQYHELLKCEVTDCYTNKVQRFPFSPQPSVEKPGEDTTRATTESTRRTENSRKAGIITTASAINDASTELQGDKQTATTKSTRTTENPPKSVTTTAAISDTKQKGWWWLIIVAVGVAALLIIIVVVIRWKRTKGKKTQMDENIMSPETSQDTADPEDGVSYASISYTRKTNSKARDLGKDDDEDEAVTYTTLKTSSSSAGASADPSNLYATVKPNKEESTV